MGQSRDSYGQCGFALDNSKVRMPGFGRVEDNEAVAVLK
jgi:hypothetical protein